MTKLVPGNPQLLQFISQRLNCSVILRPPGDAPDGQGGTTRSWAPSGADVPVMAAVDSLTGRERLAEGGAGVSVTHRILIAWRTDVRPTWRVYYGIRMFDIHTCIDYSEQHLLTELMVEERYAI